MARNVRRILLAATVCLAIASGCSVPGSTGSKPVGGKDQTQFATHGVLGSSGAAGTGGAGVQGPAGTMIIPSIGPDLTSPAPGASGGQTGLRQPPITLPSIDPKTTLVGRVLVLPGILSNNGGNVVGQNGGSIISNNGGGVVGQNGASVIGEHGAGVIGEHGAGVIGEHGAGIISNNGGSIAFAQRPLAYAAVRLFDASGNEKRGLDGYPITVYTDGSGVFSIHRSEVDSNSFLVVSDSAFNGTISAFVAKGGGGQESIELDFVSSLTSGYIFDKYVDGRQARLDRLTPAIESEARQIVSRGLTSAGATSIVRLDSKSVEGVVSELRSKDIAVEGVFERIRSLMVEVGIVNGGEGLPAVTVPLGDIDGMAIDDDGMYLYDSGSHTLRRIDDSGVVQSLVPPNEWPYPEVEGFSFGEVAGLCLHNGWLYLCDRKAHRVVRIRSGKVEIVAGSGMEGVGVEGVDATEAKFDWLKGLVVAQNGAVYFSDANNHRIYTVDVNGKLRVAVGGGGIIEATQPIDALSVDLNSPSGLTLDEDGRVLIADSGNNRIRVYDPKSGAVTDLSGSVGVARFETMQCSSGVVYALSSVPTLVHEIRDGVAKIFVPSGISYSTLPEQWARGNGGFCIWKGKLFTQIRNKTVAEVDLTERRFIRAVAGQTQSGTTNTLIRARSMAINSAGDIAISDPGSGHIFLKRASGELESIAGVGESRFVEHASNAKVTAVYNVWDLLWESSRSIVFCTSIGRPGVFRLSLDGPLDLIAGTGSVGPETAISGPALATDLHAPQGMARTGDGALLLFDAEGSVNLMTGAGFIEPVPLFSAANTESRHPFTIGDAVYFSRVRNRDGAHGFAEDVFKLERGSLTRVIDYEAINAAFPGAGNKGSQFPWFDVVAVDNAGRVYIALSNRIFQFDLDRGRSRVLAGRNGVVLNRDTRDESLRSVVDLEFAPNGDLLILEEDQLKRLPAAALAFP